MNHTYSSWLTRRLARPLAALGLLLATAGAAQAQVSFGTATTYATAGGDQGIVTADFNGDGRPDLATASSTTNSVSVLLQSSTVAGTFLANTSYSSGGAFNPTLAVGDLNGDGRPDIATINQGSSTVGVLLNSATTPGTFAAAVTYSTGSNGGRGIGIADVNGDDRLDLVATTGTAVSILLNSATAPGTFGTAATYSGGGATLDELKVGDLNGDGRPDVVVGSINASTVSVLLNSATAPGTFNQVSTYAVNGSSDLRGVALGDLNNDGRLDIVVSNSSTKTISLLFNSATAPGTFLSAVNYSNGSSQIPLGIAIGDLTGDGRADIVVSNYDYTSTGVLSVLVNSATTPGTFPTTPVLFATGGVTAARALIRDLNADGRPDLAASNFSSNTVGVLLNTTVFAPTLTSISPTSATAGTSVTLTGSNLTGATAVTFAGTSNNTVTTGLTVSGTGSNQTITVVVPTGANPGNVTVTTPNGTSNGVAFTALPPAAPVAVLPTNNSTTNSSPVFQVNATPGSYVSVYLNGVSPGQYLTPSNGIVQAQYSGLADGVYTLYATATAQRSGAPVSANSNTLTFTVDGTAPTATISTTSGSPTSTAPIPFSVSFSEPVTGFSASSLTVTNGTVTSGPTSSGTNAYTFSVTPTGNGVVTVSLRANAVRDAVGNGNTASNSVSVQYTAPIASGISVQYQTGDLGQPTDNQLRPFLQLVNSGATAVPYSSLTIRYWLTAENFMGQLVTPIDWAKLGTSFVSARYVALATPRQGAFGYIEYSFAAGAGSLAAGTDSGPIYGKAYKPDYTNFNETDDWSYQTSSSFTTNDHVTLYQNGTLLGGTEPPAVAATTSIRVFAGNQDTSPATSYLNVTLQVANMGNRPVSYSDLTVRYYFTRDGATTLVPQVDYAKLGANNISVRYVPLGTPLNGADGYLEIGFSSALGVFYPSTNTDNIQFKIRKGDYTAFTQTNDYSFSSSSAVVTQPRVPAYLNGVLVYGTEPSAIVANTARNSQETSARASAADAEAATTSAALALALTASPNPFGDQLRLAFALPTAQAYTLAVYDGQGRLVQQLASGEAAAGQAQELAVPTQGYAAGLYLVRLTTASGTQHLKLIKQ